LESIFAVDHPERVTERGNDRVAIVALTMALYPLKHLSIVPFPLPPSL
jgi:hypothetical protein